MTLTEIQDALGQLATRPRQSLGQNFLHDQNIARWIVAQLHLQPGEHVVEVGPGLGALSEQFCDGTRAVTLIEKDGRMVDWLRGKFLDSNVELFHMDALDFDLRKLWGKGPVKIVGNLPYYVSTPLIAKYASALSPASILVLTLQHEVAARLGATPGTKEYGAMTVCTQRRWKVRYLKKLPASVFYPQPQVSSAVVALERKPATEVVPCDDGYFESVVRRGFSQRRKQLQKLLPEFKARVGELCEILGVPESVRAEELSVSQWETLARRLAPGEAQSGEEIFSVVDEEDRIVSSETRQDIHVNNLRHRAVHMLIFNAQGELFLQKRSIWKDKSPGLWDSSAAGHVDAGEDYVEAARRELKEELGVECSLRPVGKLACSAATGWEFIEVYRGEAEGGFTLASMEIETGAFFPLEQVRTWAARQPEEFSSVFLQCLDFLP